MPIRVDHYRVWAVGPDADPFLDEKRCEVGVFRLVPETLPEKVHDVVGWHNILRHLLAPSAYISVLVLVNQGPECGLMKQVWE